MKLKTLQSQIAACTRCVLSADRTQTVFGEGNINARVMFIGEAPGADEDEKGRPFVGRAGKLLDAMILACGWEREDVYIANILKCRPPKNRIPEAVEIHSCSNFLERQIAIVNPEFIVCLGSVASNTIVGLPINEARGNWYYYKHHKVLCTYHPAYLLRNEDAKRFVWGDLKILLKAMGNESQESSSQESSSQESGQEGGEGGDSEGNPVVGHQTANKHCCEVS